MTREEGALLPMGTLPATLLRSVVLGSVGAIPQTPAEGSQVPEWVTLTPARSPPAVMEIGPVGEFSR